MKILTTNFTNETNFFNRRSQLDKIGVANDEKSNVASDNEFLRMRALAALCHAACKAEANAACGYSFLFGAVYSI